LEKVNLIFKSYTIKGLIKIIIRKRIPVLLNEKKYINLRNKLILINSSENAVESSLNLFKIDYDNRKIKIFFENLFFYLHFDDNSRKNLTESFKLELIKVVKDIDPRMLKVHEWKALYYISSTKGEFVLANEFKELAVEKSLSYEFKILSNPFIWDLKFRALLDIGDFKNAIKLLQKLKYSPWAIFYPIKFMRASVMTFPGNRYACLPYLMKKALSNKKYLNFISNKRIAILGPAPSTATVKDVLNDFDIVIRLNYRGSDFLIDDDLFNKKIDISYYNGENGDNLIRLENKVFLNDLAFANTKGDISKLIDKNFQYKFKLMISPNISFLGSYNMIPLVIFDLLFYNPKSIKIFKTTFFINKNSYDPKYQLEKNLNISKQNHKKSFTEHNPISQIRYIRNLFRSKVVSVDEECEKVLNLSDEKYLEILENEYS